MNNQGQPLTLDEQLAMATQAVPVAPTQPTQQVAQVQNVQPTQQVVQPNYTTTQAPAQNVQPVYQQAPVYQQPVQAPIASSIDLAKASDDAETQYAANTLELGQKISNRAIDKLLLKEHEKCRVTVVGQPFFVPVHKCEALNNAKLVCWSNSKTGFRGQCCKDLDNPRINYCLPVLVYSTYPNDPRMALPQGKSELKLIALWDEGSWDKFCEQLIDNGGFAALNNLDFIVTAGTYNNLDLTIQPANMCFRPQYQEAVKNATDAWNSIGIQGALPTMGRLLNDEKYLKLTQVATPPVMQEYNMNDINN